MPIVTSKKQDGPVVITHKQAQKGFAELFDSSSRNLDVLLKQNMQHHCILDGHPFGLETRLHGMLQARNIWLIAYTGVTDQSVAHMKLVLRHYAVLYPVGQSLDFRLRIIRIQRPELKWSDPDVYIHDLFFELITNYGTFICGGVNDYSGSGGDGGARLESVFEFLAALYEKPLEEVVIFEADAEPMLKKLNAAYSAFKQEQRKQEVA